MLPKSSPAGRASSSLSRWLATAADAPCAPTVVAVGWLGAFVSAGFVSVDDWFGADSPWLGIVSSVDMNTPAQQIAWARLRSFARRSDRGSVNIRAALGGPFLVGD